MKDKKSKDSNYPYPLGEEMHKPVSFNRYYELHMDMEFNLLFFTLGFLYAACFGMAEFIAYAKQYFFPFFAFIAVVYVIGKHLYKDHYSSGYIRGYAYFYKKKEKNKSLAFLKENLIIYNLKLYWHGDNLFIENSKGERKPVYVNERWMANLEDLHSIRMMNDIYSDRYIALHEIQKQIDANHSTAELILSRLSKKEKI